MLTVIIIVHSLNTCDVLHFSYALSLKCFNVCRSYSLTNIEGWYYNIILPDGSGVYPELPR
jgi:hypothetical protein